ncbi:MAG TPA: extracellular solute-binding protein, partial [Limnochordia bacterium]
MARMLRFCVLSLVISIGGLAAEAIAAAPVTLSFAFVAGEEELPAWEGIVEAWNAHSETVKVEALRLSGGWDQYREQMMVQVAAGTPPDIGRMAAEMVPAMAAAGAIIDLLPYAERDPLFRPDAYFAPAISSYYTGDHLWGMPISILPVAYYANTDLFASRGVALPERAWSSTWSWDSWQETLKKLTFGQEPNRTYGAHVEPWIMRSIQFFWQNGVNIFNADRTRSQFDDPRAIEVLRLFARLWHQDRTAWTDRAGMGWGDLYHLGRLGMFADGPWMIPWVRNAPVESTVLPMPIGPAGPATINFIDAYVVYRGSQHPREAWEVVRFFTERAAVEVQLRHGSTGIPSRRDLAFERLEQRNLFPGLSLEEQQVWLEAVTFSRSMPFTTNWAELMNEAIMPAMTRLFRDEIPPEEAA